MKKKLFLAVIAVVIICIGIYLSFRQIDTNVRYEREYSEENIVPLYELTDAGIIQEKVQLDKGTYTGLGLRFGTYGQEAEGNLIVEIRDVDSEYVLASGKMDISSAVDNSICQIEFEQEFQVRSEKEYELIVTGEGLVTGKTITLFAYDGAEYSELSMNQELLHDKELIVNFYQEIFDLKRCLYLIISLLVLEFYVVYVIKVVTEEV